jgi:hypothetical protein
MRLSHLARWKKIQNEATEEPENAAQDAKIEIEERVSE